MAQKQGNSSTAGGRIDGSIGSPVVAADIALGAGWGNAASVAVAAGSTDQRGACTVTSGGTGQAQATATCALTFHDGAYQATPFGSAELTGNTHAVTEAQPQGQSCSTTGLAWCHSVIPVSANTYTFNWCVVA